jgi:pimeloyl-ACP methyl ester carboxylesterase
MPARFSRVVGRYVYVPVQGHEYRVYFEEAGQGTPVLFQHTAGSDGRQWRYLLESSELTSRFRFVAHDLPYHGKSLPPLSKAWWRERYSLSQSFLVEFMEAMVGALEMEKPIYVGCSMGGHLAPDLALLRPGLFRAVVAVEGGLATHDPEPFNKYLSHPRASNEAKAALMMSQTSPKSPEPHRRETVWVYSQGAPQVFQGDLDYYLGEHDLTKTAAEIDTSRTQVHVISGDYDWSATPERAKALADAIPGATYTRMEGMGHFPMSEDPKSFERYLAALLDRIVAGKP